MFNQGFYNEESITIGGRVMRKDGLILLFGGTGGTNQYSELKRQDTLASLVVPANFVFEILAFEFTSLQTGIPTVYIGYGNSGIGFDVAAGPAGAVVFTDSFNNGAIAPAAGVKVGQPVTWRIPASKFPFLSDNLSFGVTLIAAGRFVAV